ncbi:MAG TPA: cupredoxin domain-containing protein [Thermoanaerobaculia bacterium]|nr:cupredoxin domain-containing protein [Thermoanaerobaculia bacterium]
MRALVLIVSLVLPLACQQKSHAPHASQAAEPAGAPVAAETSGDVQIADLKISGGEYQPASLSVRAGVPLRLNVTRDDKPGCGEVLSIPSQNIKRDIPLNQVTTIEFTPQQPGAIEFTCGMNMMRGSIVVQETEV